MADEEQVPAIEPVVEPEVQPEQVAPVLPSGKTVQFVQEDGSIFRAIVLQIASDGSLHLLTPTADGRRSETGGVHYVANKSIGTWHEA